MESCDRSEMIDLLMRQRYPGVNDVSPIGLWRRRSAGFRDAQAMLDYRKELKALDDNELGARAEVASAEIARSREAQRRADAERAETERRNRDRRWAAQTHWTIEEFVALSLGADPDRWTANYIQDLERRGGWKQITEPYRKRESWAHRGITKGQLPSKPSPKEWIEWAAVMALTMPQTLAEAVTGTPNPETKRSGKPPEVKSKAVKGVAWQGSPLPEADLRRWFEERVAEVDRSQGRIPTQKECIRAAKKFAAPRIVTRARVLAMRDECAPHWRKPPGPRSSEPA